MADPVATCAVAIASEATGAPNETWVHLMPAGSFDGRDGRGPWKAEDLGAIVTASRDRAGKGLVAVDYDHQIDLAPKNGQPAPAAGWIKRFKARRDGIWALVEWTERAAAFIRDREYRYLSPVFTYEKGTGRVTRILRAALTNNPNLELTALARAGGTMDEDLQQLRDILGLTEDADMAAIIAAVRALVETRQSADPDPARYVPVETLEAAVGEVRKLNRGIALGAAEAVVSQEIGAGHLPPFLKDWAVSLCTVNKPAFDGFIARTGKSMSKLFAESRAVGVPPGDAANPDGLLTDEQRAVCSNLGLKTEDYLKTIRSR